MAKMGHDPHRLPQGQVRTGEPYAGRGSNARGQVGFGEEAGGGKLLTEICAEKWRRP